jgi:hypothetical protein
MSDKTDIVERLRKRSSKMRGFRFFFSAADMDAAEAEITRLRAELMISNMERDAAQREICERNARENRIVLDSINRVEINTPEREAQIRGWKCYDAEGAKP